MADIRNIWRDLKPTFTLVTIVRTMAPKGGIPSNGYPINTFDIFITASAKEVDPLILKKIAFRRINTQGVGESVVDFDILSLYSFKDFSKWENLNYDLYTFPEFEDENGEETM